MGGMYPYSYQLSKLIKPPNQKTHEFILKVNWEINHPKVEHFSCLEILGGVVWLHHRSVVGHNGSKMVVKNGGLPW